MDDGDKKVNVSITYPRQKGSVKVGIVTGSNDPMIRFPVEGQINRMGQTPPFSSMRADAWIITDQPYRQGSGVVGEDGHFKIPRIWLGPADSYSLIVKVFDTTGNQQIGESDEIKFFI